MKGRSALALISCCALFAPGRVAWAQDDDEEESEEAAPAEDEGQDEASGSEEGSTEEDSNGAMAAATSRWPRAIIARPLTLPKGLIQLGAALNANNDFSALTLGINAAYGVSDDLEVKVSYGFALKELEAKGELGFEGGYKVLRGAAGGKLEVIARAGAGYSFLAEELTLLRLGAQAQYNLSDKLAVISPGSQLVVSLTDNDLTGRPVFLQLPVAVGYQVTPEVYVQVDTTLAIIDISDSANTIIFADATPLLFSGFYNAMPNLDVFAAIGTDLTNSPGDSLTFQVGATYFLGEL